MSKDHKLKEPTKNEKIMYELMLAVNNLEKGMQQMQRIIQDVNMRVIAVTRAKLDPEAMAKFMLDDVPNKSYMARLNAALDKEIASKKAAEAKKEEPKNDNPTVAK